MNKNLKEFRTRWDLTQEEVSVLLGVRQPAWNMWETGRREVPGYVMKEISFFERMEKRVQREEINRAKAETHVQQVDRLRDEWG
jgi:transcriptional regulator with XRE-family HTH domain